MNLDRPVHAGTEAPEQTHKPPAPADASAAKSDAKATTTTDTAAATPRQLFTMTVDQVAGELYTYGVYRDIRTIQRWCKAGKLRSMTGTEPGQVQYEHVVHSAVPRFSPSALSEGDVNSGIRTNHD